MAHFVANRATFRPKSRHFNAKSRHFRGRIAPLYRGIAPLCRGNRANNHVADGAICRRAYTAAMGLEFKDVSHRYGNSSVLRDVALTASPGEITCLLGASGSGKTTLLRLAAGLERLQTGEIRLDGATLCTPGEHPPPEQRPVGLVFQEHVLFPHKTVLDNVAFGLRETAPRQRRAIAEKSLDAVGLSAFASRFPDTLSGGQQQRVALARSLAPSPRVLLLDEPFANVDATLRRSLREDARQALRRSGSIAVIVTHDPEEALELADRIAVMDHGRIAQVGTPEEIWREPAERAVAALFGETQRLFGRVAPEGVMTPFGRVDWARANGNQGAAVDVLIRPAGVALGRAADDAEATATVADIRFLGDRYLVLVDASGQTLRASVADLGGIRIGDRVVATLDAERAFVYLKDRR